MTLEEFELNLTLMGFKLIPEHVNNFAYREHYSNGSFDVFLPQIRQRAINIYKVDSNKSLIKTISYLKIIEYLTEN